MNLQHTLNIYLEHLKFALNQEIAEWIRRYVRSCHEKYRKEMNEVFKYIESIETRLTREIRDLEDIRLIMMAVKDLRENEIRLDMQISPIEEAYSMFQKSDLHLSREEHDRADSLRYRYNQLQQRCVSK